MKSKPCLALFVGHASSNWGMYLFLTSLPTYMKEVLKFDVKSVNFVPHMKYDIIIAFTLFVISRMAFYLQSHTLRFGFQQSYRV